MLTSLLMDLLSLRFYNHDSEAFSQINSQPPISFFSPPHLHTSHTTFPIIAIAVIGILSTGLLLVSYYVFAIKCCLNWHGVDIFRRFSFAGTRATAPAPAPAPVVERRGLTESAIRSIPIIRFRIGEENDRVLGLKSWECVVCLNDFQPGEKLRKIPDCGHFFHIDCIDVWLQTNPSCPVCRTSISDQIRVPSPSPQDSTAQTEDMFTGRDEDYVVIEFGSEQETSASPPKKVTSISPSPGKIYLKKRRKLKHISSMGDECLDINRQKDEQFVVQPLRRSFSMDSADDRQLYLAVQEIIMQGQKPLMYQISPNESCSTSSSSSRGRRLFFSFGQGKISRSAVLPVTIEA